MGCQREIAAQIVDQGADYVLGLKVNQSFMQEAVADYFTTAETGGFQGVRHDYNEEIDKGHGFLERRRYWITDDLSTLPDSGRWKGLRSIGMAQRECIEGEKQTVERRYLLNSIPPNAAQLATAVRGHWRIENRLHWCLDVTFNEDSSRIRNGNAPAILTGIRHLYLNQFRKEATRISLKKKRLKPAWSDDFRSKVLFA